jgi:hypothetical protein
MNLLAQFSLIQNQKYMRDRLYQSKCSMASNLCALSTGHDANIPELGQDLPRRTLLGMWAT